MPTRRARLAAVDAVVPRRAASCSPSNVVALGHARRRPVRLREHPALVAPGGHRGSGRSSPSPPPYAPPAADGAAPSAGLPEAGLPPATPAPPPEHAASAPISRTDATDSRRWPMARSPRRRWLDRRSLLAAAHRVKGRAAIACVRTRAARGPRRPGAAASSAQASVSCGSSLLAPRLRTDAVRASTSRSPRISMYGTFWPCARRILFCIRLSESSTSTNRTPAARSSAASSLGRLDVAVGDRDDDGLDRRAPQRERAREVLREDADEPLERARRSRGGSPPAAAAGRARRCSAGRTARAASARSTWIVAVCHSRPSASSIWMSILGA